MALIGVWLDEGDTDDELEVELQHGSPRASSSSSSASSSGTAVRLLTVPVAAAGDVMATCCGFGKNAGNFACRGMDMGLRIGIVAGVLTGTVTSCALGRVLAPLGIQEDIANYRLIAGMITGGPVAVVVGGSCSVLGTVAGGVTGIVQDLRVDLMSAAARTFRGVAVNIVKPVMNISLGLSFDLKDGPRKVAQLPQEALPFLAALIGARRAGVLTEEDAFGRAAGFAARCALEMPGSEIPREAELQRRVVFLLTQLQACYPSQGKESLEEIVRRLVEEVAGDALDALWLAFGPSSLQQWAYSGRGLLPRYPCDLSGDLLLQALDMRYEEEQSSMVRVLRESFPGGAGEDYHRMLERARSALPQACLWKGYRLLESGGLPRLAFASVQSPAALERARAYLASSPLPELPPDGEEAAAGSGSPASSGAVSRFPSSESGLGGRELSFDSCASASDGGCSPISLCVPRPATLAPPPALVKAVEQAQRSFATADSSPQNSEHGGLSLEVLRITGLQVGGSSGFDALSSWLIGSRSPHPYVRVALGQVGSLRPGRWKDCRRTRAVAADRKGSADFGEAVSFPLEEHEVLGTTLELLEVRFQVLDARQVFGDGVIGEGTLRLTDKMLGAFEVHAVVLIREGQTQGTLLVRAGVLTPPSALGILERSSKEPLGVVMKAFAQVLAQPCCVALLMESRPQELLDRKLIDEAVVQKMLQSWVVTFCSSVSHLGNSASEDAVVRRLAHMARIAKGIAAESAGLPEDASRVEDLLAEWLHGFCARCAGADSSIELDEARLARVFEASRMQHSRLEDLGVKLPQQLPAGLASEVFARLLEAEASEEREIFTSVRIVRDGQVAPGLAVVFQRGHQRRHIFLYSLLQIREWQRQHGTDPCTRKELSRTDILPLTAL